ncbi:MAG: MBL fold metallo-hydrolase [Phycisphaerae bacterium]|nr:MBL fold metallo-hydrolase [Phycisphaerae bacterium]
MANLTLDDLDIMGYSVAGEETVIAMPQLDVCFDIGKAPDQIVPINHVLLTHGHMDHAAGLAYYLSHRKFCGQSPGTVLAPANLIAPIRQILDAWGKLDGNAVPANLVPVTAGDEYPIKPNLFARVFPTKHSRGSVGYTVLEKRKKLKPEYAGLTGPQIVELKKQGIAIDNPVEIPLVSYLGDTQYLDFGQLPYVARSKILIAECTFYIDEHAGRADAGRHMHIDEFAKLVEDLENEYVLVTHLTQRTSMAEAKKLLREKLSPATLGKVFLLMAHMGRPNQRPTPVQ